MLASTPVKCCSPQHGLVRAISQFTHCPLRPAIGAQFMAQVGPALLRRPQVLVLFAALSTCNPGNVLDAVKAAKHIYSCT